jgi:hypothetical protein
VIWRMRTRLFGRSGLPAKKAISGYDVHCDIYPLSVFFSFFASSCLLFFSLHAQAGSFCNELFLFFYSFGAVHVLAETMDWIARRWGFT